MLLLLLSNAACSKAGSGQAGHRNVLLGMHFAHSQRDCNTRGNNPEDVVAGFWDYVKYMPEDLARMSYADFWHWWYEFERYKGDEKGLAEMDAIIDECISRGIKVKIDLAWSTWYTHDKDWETYTNMAIGPQDVDDWIHLCDLLGRRYRGRVALWLLQGEANDLKNYWQGSPIEHVHEIYKQGAIAFKRVDPGAMISVAGASPSVPREALDEWTLSNAKACKGFYDDVPMNYFGDIADPYKGLDNYYKSIRKILDDIGEHDVEIGSGESSFQWAETSEKIPVNPPTSMEGFDVEKTPLCELKQAWRCNESLGTFFELGGTKFVQWGTEYAPGGGWAWRWGFRKYQDWWGNWPESDKIPGTNIVFGDKSDGKNLDFRPGWTSSQADPYHPMWKVFEFWAQATPPAMEAIRINMNATGSGPRILKLATYLRAEDKCVGLLQNDQPTPMEVSIDLSTTGWPNGAAVTIAATNEAIDYARGTKATNWTKALKAKVTGGKVSVKLPSSVGFTTLTISPAKPGLAAEFVDQVVTSPAEVGKPMDLIVLVRNTGTSTWLAKSVALSADGPAKQSWKLAADVKPGEVTSIPVRLPAPEAAGRAACFVRLRNGKQPFGPAFCVGAAVTDPTAPRKLVAFREYQHIRLKWFAPEKPGAIDHYELYRAPGFGKPFAKVASVRETGYIDMDLRADAPYYYYVVAVDGSGKVGRPSNEDNAKASSARRIWDAEIVEHTVPTEVNVGQSDSVTITIRNTGSKPWNLASDAKTKVYLRTMQQWGIQEDGKLPVISLGSTGVVSSGESVTVTVPYAAIREGRFENHWVVCADTEHRLAYIGSPLLVETEAKAK